MLKTRKKIKMRKKSKQSKKRTVIKGGNNNNNNNSISFLDSLTLHKGNYILFCSEGYRTILDGELPPMKYVWAQVSSEELMPQNSWFCPYKRNNNMVNNTYYVYKIIKDLTVLFVPEYSDFGDTLIKYNKLLKNKLRFPVMEHANDYVNIELQYNLFNIDGIFRNPLEIILFSPFNDKLEFVKRYGGENLKTKWNKTNIEKKGYFTPSNELIKEVKNSLVLLPEYNKIKEYIK